MSATVSFGKLGKEVVLYVSWNHCSSSFHTLDYYPQVITASRVSVNIYLYFGIIIVILVLN